MKKTKRILLPIIGTAFASLWTIAKARRSDSIYSNEANQKNPFEGKTVKFIVDENDAENADGVRGHLEETGDSVYMPNVYEEYAKRGIDLIVSFVGLLVLSPVLGALCLAIKIDDPGPVLFTQKRVGKDKQFFKLHKFRSMKMSTPHDVPTHMLDDPEQYITNVGRFIREHSLDELPQIWDIFVGNMSIIGPRPALWNQDVLIAEREKYGANEVKPGLTGWAQINGRDELELEAKARFDGEYVEKIKNGGIKAFLFDCRCFIGTIFSVANREGVVEGGTGAMRDSLRPGVPDKNPETPLGCDLDLIVDDDEKKVLITGAGSYIGEAVKEYAEEHFPTLKVDTIDMIDGSWREKDFSKYNCVYHVAGIAHADVGNVSEEIKEKYYSVNTDLAIEVAQKAKSEGVNQFIFMSSMIVYGESAPYGKEKIIDRNTTPEPANFYGDSKWQADKGVRALADDNFKVAVLRPPMIYGRGSKGNYPKLAKYAKILPVFPDVKNQRSMLHIDNLCEFVCNLIICGEGGVFMPQNSEYTNTSKMVADIAKATGKTIHISKTLKPAVVLASLVPGEIGNLVNKAFGNNCYDQELSNFSFEYRVNSLNDSIFLTEGTVCERKDATKKHILLISQYFYPESFRVNDIAAEWVKRGYKVTVLTGIPNYPMGKFYDGYDYIHKRKDIWNGVEIIRIPLIPRGNNENKLLNAVGMSANYLSFIASGKYWVKHNNIDADIVFTVEVSPMTQALIGVWYSKCYNIPSFLYVQDLWPENVETVTGIHNRAIIGPIDRMVDSIYKNTDMILTTSPSFVDAIINRRIKVPKEKVRYWPQYAEDFYKPMSKQIIKGIPDDNTFRIAFTGNIGTAQGLDILPQTASLLNDEDIRFVIVGDGRYQPELKKKIAEIGVGDKFIFIPRVPAEEVPAILSACDACFISFNNTSLWEMTIPAKLQSYMACGKPIVASASGETKRIIEEASCGICTSIGDPVDLAEGIRYLLKSDCKLMGENARLYFDEHFDKKKLMDQLDALIWR